MMPLTKSKGKAKHKELPETSDKTGQKSYHGENPDGNVHGFFRTDSIRKNPGR